MKSVFIILHLVLLVAISFGKGSKKTTSKPASKSGGKSGAKSGGKSGGKSSATSKPGPLDRKLCRCFDIDLMCDPITNGDEICYYYTIKRDSSRPYCREDINYFAIGNGDLSECGVRPRDIENILTDYAPKCYNIDPNFKGSNVDGIKFKEGCNRSDGDKSGSKKGGKSSPTTTAKPKKKGSKTSPKGSKSSTTTTAKPKKKGSKTSPKTTAKPKKKGSKLDPKSSPKSKSKTTSAPPAGKGTIDSITIEATGDLEIFSLCFDASSSYVSGTQENGEIEISVGDDIITCDVPDILPDFCGSTPSPTFADCDTDDALNIAFLLDESGSIDRSEWKVITDFVNRVISFDIASTSYVSLFEYGSKKAYKQFLDFTPVTDTSVFSDALSLKSNSYNRGGRTFTWDAVNRVLDTFWDYRSQCNDGCETRKDLLFLLTDGAPSDTVCPDMIDRVNKTDIDIVVIGVPASAGTWADQVSCLDYRDNEQDIYIIPEFDSDEFNAIEGAIREKTCNGFSPAGNPVRPAPGSQWVYADGSIGLGPVPTATRSGNGKGKGGAGDPIPPSP